MKLMNNGGGQWKYFDLHVRLFTSFDQLRDKYSVSITVCGPWSVTFPKNYDKIFRQEKKIQRIMKDMVGVIY